MDGVIRPLKTLTQQAQADAPSGRRLGCQSSQGLGLQVMRAGAGHERAAGLHQVQAQFVETAIGLQALAGVLATFDESGRVQTYQIEAATVSPQIGQYVQGVAVQAVDFRVGAAASALRRAKSRAVAEASAKATDRAPCRTAKAPKPPA